jgi:hypothetical protein
MAETLPDRLLFADGDDQCMVEQHAAVDIPRGSTANQGDRILRMQMMPYWYSEFAKYHYEGTPPFRGMSLEEGFGNAVKKEVASVNHQENPYEEAVTKEVKDQYMAGEYLLVAPLFTGQTSRKVVLPKGKWYDFYTGKLAGDGEVITVSPGLDIIPVFVKDGGIIPMMPSMLHAPKARAKSQSGNPSLWRK